MRGGIAVIYFKVRNLLSVFPICSRWFSVGVEVYYIGFDYFIYAQYTEELVKSQMVYFRGIIPNIMYDIWNFGFWGGFV